MTSRTRQSGFTLLELILVMVIICVVLGMAAPSLRGWSRGSALRDAADELLAVTRLARSQAATSGNTCRLCIDADGGYHLETLDGNAFVPVSSDLGRPARLSEEVHVELVKLQPAASPQTQQRQPWQQQQPEQCVDFFPTGRTEPARLLVISAQAGTIEIACASPAEPFEIVRTGEGT